MVKPVTGYQFENLKSNNKTKKGTEREREKTAIYTIQKTIYRQVCYVDHHKYLIPAIKPKTKFQIIYIASSDVNPIRVKH